MRVQPTASALQQNTWYLFELSRTNQATTITVKNVDQNLEASETVLELSTTGATNRNWGIYSYSQVDNSF